MNDSANVFLQLLGRLHPLVVHFPIALLIVAGVVELFRSKREKPSDAGLLCLVVGGVSACLAAWWGWLFADIDHAGLAGERLLFLHRWSGVATASIAIVTTALALTLRKTTKPALVSTYRGGLFLCLVLVSYSAHLGGTLAYGEGFLLELFQEKEGVESAPEAALPPARADVPPATIQAAELEATFEEPEAPPPVAPATPGAPARSNGVDYLTQVLPIFQANCFECHGSKGRAKGGLRLSDMGYILAEEEPEFQIIHVGSGATSPLVERISLPSDHEDFMPKDGDPLSAEEIRVITDWIDAGASWEELPVEETETVSVEEGNAPLPVPTPATLQLTEVQRADSDRAIAGILAAGGHAGRIARNTDEVDVNLGLLAEEASDETLALLAGLEPCLVSLDLSRTGVTDAGLGVLARFPVLRRLRLDNTGVGDDALTHVAVLERLAYLNLVGTSVTDVGMARLTGLAGLERLYVWQTDVTDAGVESLEEALPALTIVRDTYVPIVVEAEEEGATELRAACCDAAEEAGNACDHPCCVEAAADGEPCPKCAVPVAAGN